MARLGHTAESNTLHARLGQAGPGVARALGITTGDAVVHWKRLRIADGEVVAIEDAYLNEVMLPGFLQAPLPPSLYDELGARGLRPTWAEDTVTADLASPTRPTCSASRPAPPCSARPAARSPATPWSRYPAPATAPTSTRSACSSASTPNSSAG